MPKEGPKFAPVPRDERCSDCLRYSECNFFSALTNAGVDVSELLRLLATKMRSQCPQGDEYERNVGTFVNEVGSSTSS